MALREYRATAHWKRIRLQVLRRDAYTCTYCGMPDANEVDHVYPKSRGGEDTLDNLVACCRTCNIKKKDSTDVFLAHGSTPPAFPNSLSPKRANQSKSVRNGHTSVRVDPESPFISPDQLGAN